MHRIYWTVCAVALLIACSATVVYADATATTLLMRSASSNTLAAPGYVGTYLSVPDSGNGGSLVDLTFNASATGAGNDPHMNIVVGDSKFGFNLANAASQNYSSGSFFLPAGTHVLRVERDYSAASARTPTVNSVSVTGTGVTFLNTGTDTTLSGYALAAADTYIENYRKTDTTIKVQGVAPGTPVTINMTRHAFNFGNAVPGSSLTNVNSYLGTTGTTQQTNYQARLNQNFNALTPENAGKWSSNEGTRDNSTSTAIGAVDRMLDYAEGHNMRSRMHNLIWGNQQPGWLNTMLGNPAGADADTGLGNLLGVYGAGQSPNPNGSPEPYSEIKERINYYIGDGPGGLEDHSPRYVAVDVYNETLHTGVNGGANSYWNRYGINGVASIYNDVKLAVAASGGTAQTFVNEYNVLNDSSDSYSNWYFQHIDALRDAGHAQSFGEVVGGIGIQYYVNPNDGNPNAYSNADHWPHRITRVLQNMSVHGLPLTLTEFGSKNGSSEADGAVFLEDTARLMFGSANADGFFMWGFVAENGGGNLFAPDSALYNVNTSNWNSWTITEAGKAWQDMLGIQDWDGNPNNGWNSDQATTVNANGEIEFNGFYGDYIITIDGDDYALSLNKGGQVEFLLPINPGDFDYDGDVDADDIDILFDNQGANPLYDLDGDDDADHADVNELVNDILGTTFGDADLDGDVDGADFDAWRIRDSLGDPIGWATGDWDGDGDVDGGDFDLWRERPDSIPGGGIAAVPEPATLVLLALAIPALIACRRKSN